MLKHLSTKPQLSEEEEKEAHTLLLAFTKQGLRFAFYKDLPEHLTEGFQIGDRMFIEERQRAEAKVTIHYRTNAEETWKSEPMRNMYQGIFVKEFLLFYGEKMEYYLTFTNRQGEGKTEVKTVSMTGEPKAGRTRYQLLNQMKQRARQEIRKKQKKHSESICSRRLWFGTVLHLWRKRSSRRIRHGTEKFDFRI